MELSLIDYGLVCFGFFIVAIVYSSVGHAGASGYTAVLAFVNFSSLFFRPVSLTLNIVVGIIALIRFHKAKLIPYKKVLPFVIGSFPFSFYGAWLDVRREILFFLLGCILFYTALKFIVSFQEKSERDPVNNRCSLWLAVLIGAMIGFMSGITGTGGAIFFTPLLLQFKWAQPRNAAGMSILFVFLNSISGVVGSYKVLPQIFTIELIPWIIFVCIGSMIGTFLGIAKFSNTSLKRMLGLVLIIASIKFFVMAFK